jgi:hypothetical protein
VGAFDKQLSAATDVQSALGILDEGATLIYSASGDPAGSAGGIYFNTTDNEFRGYNGSAWGAIGGGGGAFSTQNFTATGFTAEVDGFQRWRYTGSSAITLASIDRSNLDDAEVIVIMGTSDTNTVTVNSSTAGIARVNGDWEGGLYNTLTLQNDSAASGLIETGRT